MADTGGAAAFSANKWCLTPVMAPFLDKHLIFPLLEFLQKKEIHSADELEATRAALTEKTNMVDSLIDMYAQNHPGKKPPAALLERREAVVAKLVKLKTECKPLLQITDDHELIDKLKQEKHYNFQYFHDTYGITEDMLDSLYEYARFQFNCGVYSVAAEYLYHYRALSQNSDQNMQALWGKLAAEILTQHWDSARNDLNLLKDAIDLKQFTNPVNQLQQRVWLIHWSLFVFFNHEDGRNGIIDMFFQEKYLNAIQTACPWILRYLTTAVILNRRRRHVLKDLVKVIQQERYAYADPITEFLECLYVKFDFEGAQTKLRECEELLANDFFLVACRDAFIENARLFIFETYCRIHQCIDVSMLAQKLNMGRDQAERWIVNLIRNARLDAKIDSQNNQVIMGTQYPSIYQQVIEMTKGLSFRSYVLATNVERREQGLESIDHARENADGRRER